MFFRFFKRFDMTRDTDRLVFSRSSGHVIIF